MGINLSQCMPLASKTIKTAGFTVSIRNMGYNSWRLMVVDHRSSECCAGLMLAARAIQESQINYVWYFLPASIHVQICGRFCSQCGSNAKTSYRFIAYSSPPEPEILVGLCKLLPPVMTMNSHHQSIHPNLGSI